MLFSSSANTFSTSCSSVNDVSIVAYVCVLVFELYCGLERRIILNVHDSNIYIYIYINGIYLYYYLRGMAINLFCFDMGFICKKINEYKIMKKYKIKNDMI